ncbi:MAG: cytochrome c peroxidase [Mariprofundaceae bacterium]|nr:cytochrome c peroxidase [Mariprofundaceae bacterium]
MLAIIINQIRLSVRGRRETIHSMEVCLLRTAIFFLFYTLGFPYADAAPPAHAAGWMLPPVSYPSSNPYSAAKTELGRKLFFDPRLSGNPAQTCATCHHPGLGWADATARTIEEGHALGRHTPSLINIGYAKAFFWDGRATSLEDAVSQDILSPAMSDAKTPRDIVVRIASMPGYRHEFRQAFGTEGVNFDRITASLATFIRGIVSASSPFDHWLNGNDKAIPDDAKKGFVLFTGKAGCVRCHTGPTFTDSRFHNTGINSVDPGHFEISGKKTDRNAFKTPGLRDVAITPPYMHNGSKKSLVEVINFYNRGGDRIGEGNELSPLNLDAQEKQDLFIFLRSLTGKQKETAIPLLPVNSR